MSKEELGGSSIHDRTSGVASFVVGTEEEVEALAAELLTFLPDHTDDYPPVVECHDPPSRPTPEAYEVLPPSANGSYVVRDLISAVVDDGYLLEPHANWAANLVTAFATIGDDRLASSPTSRRPSPAPSISMPAKRAGALLPCAMRSICRS